MDRSVLLEALEAILDCPVKSIKNVQSSYVGRNDTDQPSSIHPQKMIDLTIGSKYAMDYTCGYAATDRAESSAPGPADDIFIDEDDFFDPQWDVDYVKIVDNGSKNSLRGGEVYERPFGWMRFAVRVYDKYTDGNSWLRKGSDGWPVSYHGTSIEGAKAIIESWYQAGSGAAHGRGIYSTPNVGTAEGYAKTFTSKITNKTYKVALQNRINPKARVQCPVPDYWLVPVPAGTSADQEKQIVKDSLRPYGLLLKPC